MCLAVLALDAHPAFSLVLAANRDEYHARPAAPAAWWPEGLLAGRDLAAGGTWLGLTRAGRFAFVTNVRNPARHDPSAPSRGSLVPGILATSAPALVALERVVAAASRHNGFNLVAGDAAQVGWTSNRSDGVRRLATGVHGVSNGLLDDRWPKVQRTMAALDAWCRRGERDLQPLFEALADRTIAPDAELPSTGVALDWERRLSAAFIVGELYGTRCSTVVAIGRDARASFVERTFAPDGSVRGEVAHAFALGAQDSRRSMAT
jgi:uncharacterized protein with NRDE domain